MIYGATREFPRTHESVPFTESGTEFMSLSVRKLSWGRHHRHPAFRKARQPAPPLGDLRGDRVTLTTPVAWGSHRFPHSRWSLPPGSQMPRKRPRFTAKTKQNRNPSSRFSSTGRDGSRLRHLRVTVKAADCVLGAFQTHGKTVKKARRVPTRPSLPTPSPSRVSRRLGPATSQY